MALQRVTSNPAFWANETPVIKVNNTNKRAVWGRECDIDIVLFEICNAR